MNKKTRPAFSNLALHISVGITVALTTSMAWAHHSYAMFDMMKVVDIKGEVTEFRWTNPHSWITVNTKDAAGKTQSLNLEANGPGYLVKQGWKRESLKPGDMITISMNPLRDGSPGGNLVTVTFADGRVLSARPGGPAPAPTPAPAATPGAGAQK
jgi:Family of unknown function (DUF6152)